MPPHGLPDGVLAHAPHRDGPVPLGHDRGPAILEDPAELLDLRGPDADVTPGVTGRELGHGHLGDQPALADHHQLSAVFAISLIRWLDTNTDRPSEASDARRSWRTHTMPSGRGR